MAAQEAPLHGARELTSLQDVLLGVSNRIQSQWADLLRYLPNQQDDSTRTGALLHFLHGVRQQLLRTAALVNDTNKFKPIQMVCQAGSALDLAAKHANALSAAADELYHTNQHLKGVRVPIFDVQSAADVLSTGTLSSLPSRIEEFGGPKQLEAPRQQMLTNQLNHLLHAYLVEAKLPPGLELVRIAGGSALLRCEGLYEAKVSLHQQPFPPEVQQAAAEAAEAEAAAAAAGAAPEPAGGSAGVAAKQEEAAGAAPSASAAQEQKQQPAGGGGGGASGADAAGASALPQWRWQWMLLDLKMLPGAAQGPPLRQVQVERLQQAMRPLMWGTADVAALEAQVRRRAAAMGEAATSLDGGAAPSQQPGQAATPQQPQPSTSVVSGPGVSGLSGPATSGGLSGVPTAGRGLQLAALAADEVARPLHVMHGALRDVGASLLLDAVKEAAKQLAAGSRWGGHLALERARGLQPGLRLCYWLRAPAAASIAATGTGGGGEGGPALEVGIGAAGLVTVVHVPPLVRPNGTAVELHLDAATVDVEGLLLQAAVATAATQLQALAMALRGALAARQLGGLVTLRLVGEGAADAVEAAAAAGGDAAAHVPSAVSASPAPSSADGSPSLAVAARSILPQGLLAPPTLEVLVEGTPLLQLSWQLWSGKLQLRPGRAAANSNYEALAELHKEQERLHQLLHKALLQQQRTRDSGGGAVAVPPDNVLPAMADRLVALAHSMWAACQSTALLALAQQLGLRHTPDFQWLRTQGAPGTGPRLHLSFPSVPLLPHLASSSPQQGGAPQVGALCFVLTMELATEGASRCWLVMASAGPQGLPDRVLKRIPLPGAAHASGGGGRSGSGGGSTSVQQEGAASRKRPRCEQDAAATPASDQQRAPLQPQHSGGVQLGQQPLLPRVRQQVAALGAAVAWCRRRIGYEVLVAEAAALGLRFSECLPGSSSGASGSSSSSGAMPFLLLRSVPRMPLFAQLRRRPGLQPRVLGVRHVLLVAGPAGGEWAMHVHGSFYMGCLPSAAGGGNASSSGGPSSPAPGRLVFRYDAAAGQGVCGAMHDLLGLLRMQGLLHQLEWLALGPQQLRAEACIPAGSVATAAGGAAAAVAGNGVAVLAGEAGDAATLEPALKKARTGNEGAAAVLTNGNHGPDANGMQLANGSAALANGNVEGAAAAHSNGDVLAASNAHELQQQQQQCSSSSTAASALGLLWHWPGSGLVRLAGCGHSHVVLEAGLPLLLPAHAAQQQQRRLTFTLSCMPVPRPDDAAPCDPLDLRVAVACSCPAVPAALLAELGAMAAAGEAGLLLDALALTAWPLGEIARALEPAALAAAGLGGLPASLLMGSSCYRLGLRLGLARPARVHVRLMSHGRVQLALTGTAAGAQQGTRAAHFLQWLQQQEGQQGLQQQLFPYPPGAPLQGFWTHAGVLQLLVPLILSFFKQTAGM